MNLNSLLNLYQCSSSLAFLKRFTLWLDQKNESRKRLIASFVAELRSQPELPKWVLSLSTQPRRARVSALHEAARKFNRDWSTFGVASTLRRLADRSSHFAAVVRELQAARASQRSDYPAIGTRGMAHAV